MLPLLIALILNAVVPTLVGRVLDAGGSSPIPQATVQILHPDGTSSQATTDAGGNFRFEVAGPFEIEIRHPAFRTVRTVSAEFTCDDVYVLEFPMLAGDPDDIDFVELQIDAGCEADARSEPSAREGLPKSDRLFGLRGGVNVSGIAEGAGQQWVASTGNVFTSSSMSAGGVENRDFSAALADSVLTEDALPAGGQSFHGSAYLFHRNDWLNARNFFDPPDSPIPPFKYNFFGADAGGRIREETYFYLQYWGLRIRQSISRAAVVPDPAWVRGDFSNLPFALLDPNTGFEFEGNQIPESRFNGPGLALARLYPLPNLSGSTAQNYRAAAKLSTAADAFGFRIDHRWSLSDEAFLEYQFNRDTTDDPFNLLSGITNLPAFGVRDALQTHAARLNNTHVFSAGLVHQFRFSMNYLKQPRTIVGTNPLPAILMTGLSNLGHAANLPQHRRSRSYELHNELSWQRAGSSTRLGSTIRYFPFQASMDLYGRGQYQFTGAIFTGHAFANLLLGLPTNALRIQGNTDRDFRSWTTSFYLQHDWNLLPSLSVSAGLRYDYQSPFHEANGLVANFNAATGQLEASPETLYRPDRNNFGPRLGLSWRAWNDVVVRAGYGIFYDTLAVGDSLFLLGLNPPFVRFDLENNGPVVPSFTLDDAFLGGPEEIPPSIFSTSESMPNPYLQQWNLSLQRPLTRDLSVELAYFGQKGTRLRRQVNLNQPDAGLGVTLDERRPYPGFRNIFQFENSASSISHAGEARVIQRMRSWLGFSASYRFAKLIDDATLISSLPQNSHDLRAERGLGDFHVKHRLAFSSVTNLPSVPVLRGWQVQVIGIAQSGMPLSAVLGSDVAGTGSPIVNRPHLVGNPHVEDPSPARFFDPAAFVVPETGTFGTSGRNVIIGPGLWTVDLALSRSLRLTDSVRAQFRADAYNVFNHSNFVAPPSMQNFADSPEFGELFVARSPRILQFGLKFLW